MSLWLYTFFVYVKPDTYCRVGVKSFSFSIQMMQKTFMNSIWSVLNNWCIKEGINTYVGYNKLVLLHVKHNNGLPMLLVKIPYWKLFFRVQLKASDEKMDKWILCYSENWTAFTHAILTNVAGDREKQKMWLAMHYYGIPKLADVIMW